MTPTALNCHFELPPSASGSESGLTVGDRFVLSCAGAVENPLKAGAQIVFPAPLPPGPAAKGAKSSSEAAKPAAESPLVHSLQVLQLKESSNGAFSLVVTGYKPGDYKDQEFIITDGTTVIRSGPMSWKVNSILNPQQQPPPQPVPSVGPLALAWPMWLWLAIAIVLVIVASATGYFVVRRGRRKKLRAELESYRTMMTPFNQFSRDMRVLRRRLESAPAEGAGGEWLAQLDKDFRLYLIREFMVPALQVSDAELLRELRRSHRPYFESYKPELRRVLSELQKGKRDQVAKVRDADEISILIRRLVEGLNAMKTKHSKGAVN